MPASKVPALEAPDVSFSGEHRIRFESLDPQFRPGFPASDQSLSLRTSLKLDFSWTRGFLVLELLDSRAELTVDDAPRSTSLVNALEVVQAAAGWSFTPASSGAESHVSVGILTKNLGMRRLVARNRFRNTVNNFAGVDWEWRSARGRRLNAFYLHPMQRLPEDPGGLLSNRRVADDISADTVFAGLHWLMPLSAEATFAELLLLRLDGPDTRSRGGLPLDLDTLSVRAWRPAAQRRWDFEAEAAIQRGWSSSDDAVRMLRHSASFLHLEAGFSFDLPWRPRVVFQYDYASGDKDPFDNRSERFDTLYGARSFELGPSGIYGPFVRSNLKAAGFRLRLTPTPTTSVLLAYRGNWLASTTDAWGAAGLRDVAGASGDVIGRQLQTAIAWNALPGRLSFEIGLVHLRFGKFARSAPEAAGRAHSTYTYARMTVEFGSE